MLEHYFRYPRVLCRLRGGGLGGELDHISAYLFENGYRRASAKVYLSRLGRFSGHVSWEAREKPITQAVIDSFVGEHRTEAARVSARTAIGLARRIVPERFQLRGPVVEPHQTLLARYSDYLLEVCGLEAKTREGQMLVARRLLAWWDQNHGGELLSTMTGAHVLALVQHLMSMSAKDATRAANGSYARRFLRFLRWADLNDQDLARFVPRTRCYRLAHLPRQVAWKEVRRAIDAIDPITPRGSRDRAILLLLATTGIRNKELRSLTFEDIRWRDAQVLIRRTKGKRDRTVPLMQEAGKALADYVLRAVIWLIAPSLVSVQTPALAPVPSRNISRSSQGGPHRSDTLREPGPLPVDARQPLRQYWGGSAHRGCRIRRVTRRQGLRQQRHHR